MANFSRPAGAYPAYPPITPSHAMNSYTPSEMDILRHSAARYTGTALPDSIDDKLSLCLKRFHVLRDRNGQVAGFGREGFVLTPSRWGLYTWGEEHKRQAHINEGQA
jgi:hypothetical protein